MNRIIRIDINDYKNIDGIANDGRGIAFGNNIIKAAGAIILIPQCLAAGVAERFQPNEEVSDIMIADIMDIKNRTLRWKVKTFFLDEMRAINPYGQVKYNYILETIMNDTLIDELFDFCQTNNYRMICEVEVPKKNGSYPNIDIGISASGKINSGDNITETIIKETMEEIGMDIRNENLQIQTQKREAFGTDLPMVFITMKTLCHIIIL